MFSIPRNEHYKAFHDVNPLWESFEPYILKHNHRQGKAGKWTEVINRIREGKDALTKDDIKVLKSRITKKPFLVEDALHVFYTNEEVNSHNEKMLNTLKTSLETIKALKSKNVPGKINKAGMIDKTPFMNVLKVKIGARICLTSNIRLIDDLVNGSMGTVMAFERDKENEIVAIIVKFDDAKSGIKTREDNPVLSEKYKHFNGTPIFRTELDYYVKSNKGKSQGLKAKVTQFAMRLAWAFTSHKMQVSND